jgi:hypothetical protein
MGFLQKLFGGGQQPRRAPRQIAAVACPYCGVILDPPPQRNRKCPACKESIIVRTRRADGAKVLLTAADGKEFDKQRHTEAVRNSALHHARNIGASDRDFERTEQELAAKWGTAASPRDAFWQLANKTVVAAIKNADWARLSTVYWEQALYMCELGEPHLHLQKEASKAELRRYAAEFADLATGRSGLRVEVLANGCCDVCAKNHGRRYSISEALELLPIPNGACEREWCNCGWTPVLG